jgi:cysteine desulfurase
MLYLDNAATTAIHPSVVQAMTEVLSNHFGNPSSIHAIGRDASHLLRQSRKIIADILGVTPKQITFTSGGTESNNTAIIGYALAHQDQGKHLVTTEIEHHSVLHAMTYLEHRFGFEVTYVKPNSDGVITATDMLAAVRPDTILVSMMYANNETGSILPVAEVGLALKDHQAVFHVDAVQVIGKLPLNPLKMGADFISASAHKFHGPKGVGFLYHGESLAYDNLLHGGDQEEKRRAGTENLASIVGMSKALEIATKNLDANWAHIASLKAHLLQELDANHISYELNTFGETMPHVTNLGFPGHNQDMLLMKLDLKGIAVSTGSACTAGAIEPSHVLQSIYGHSSPKLKENIRISLTDTNTIDDIDQFIEILKGIL